MKNGTDYIIADRIIVICGITAAVIITLIGIFAFGGIILSLLA